MTKAFAKILFNNFYAKQHSYQFCITRYTMWYACQIFASIYKQKKQQYATSKKAGDRYQGINMEGRVELDQGSYNRKQLRQLKRCKTREVTYTCRCTRGHVTMTCYNQYISAGIAKGNLPCFTSFYLLPCLFV